MIYCDLLLGNIILFSGRPCLNNNSLVPYTYVGFPGQLVFTDTQGNSDPFSEGLGTRFLLCWFLTGPDMITIPLQAIPSQQLDITLGPSGTNTYTISVYESDLE